MNNILSLTKSFISIPSNADNTKALFDILDVAKKNLEGFTIENFEKNGKPSLLAYAGEKRPMKFKVLLNAHLDVVPGKPEQYNPYEKEEKLFGRGAYDMKAAAGVMIFIFKEMANQVSYPLGLQLVTDEEIGGNDGTKYQLEQGVLTDFIVAGENTNFAVKTEAKGIYWIKITAKGKAAHGAYPWNGDNALWKIIVAVEKLYKAFPLPTKEAWQTTINVAKIETPNTAFNKIPEEATVWLDVRFVPEDKERFLSVVEEIFSGMEVNFLEKESSAFTDQTHPSVQALTNALKRVSKQQAAFTHGHGASDVRLYTKMGTAGIEFGPIGANHHADDEWVDIKSLGMYYEILKKFLLLLS